MFKPRPNQQQVLAYSSGKMGVSAVPGSGKTETLSQLAAKLIKDGHLAADQEVLMVTLVNSAVDNFNRRVSSLVKERGLLPHVGYRVRTLHGLAHDIVRERPSLVGLEDKFDIVDERLADEIRQEVAQSWLRSHPYDLDDYLAFDLDQSKQDWLRRGPLGEQVGAIALSFIRYAKDQQLTPEALRERLDALLNPSPLAEMGCAMYADYQRALAYRGAVDFDDLIRLALRALELDEQLLQRLQRRWPFILEDEAQDSSRLQEQILRTLAGSTGNWVRVGDPNQAIFETFTTASPKYLRNFLAEDGVQALTLPHSGRSTLSIMALANHLVNWTIHEHPEPEVRNALAPTYIEPTPVGDPQPNPPDDPAHVHLIARKYSPEAEIQVVAESIARWLPDNPQATVAVLVPRNNRGFELVDALRRLELDVVDSLLRSTTSTRKAAGALTNLLLWLAEPASARRLATVYQVWLRDERDAEDEQRWKQVEAVSHRLGRCRLVEDFVAPRAGHDWLEEQEGLDEGDVERLIAFRELAQRWQNTILLPVDQLLLTLAQDLFEEPADLAIAHKLALTLRQAADEHPEWRLPELSDELAVIAKNERRFLGFDQDDSGFDPDRHKGKVVVATMHKAKGLEWDRVYLMSVNNYDFPSGQPYDTYIAERWFIRNSLNLEAEALAQLDALAGQEDAIWYRPGKATEQARLDYVRERLRLLYVGITRARKELIIAWNSGRPVSGRAELVQSPPFVALQTFWERSLRHEA